jgi:Peptidase_C39 like family
MKCLNLRRFVQDSAYCSVGAIAAVTNHHNPDVDYQITKIIANKLLHVRRPAFFQGMTTGNMAYVLYMMGFDSVIIYSCDLDYLDWYFANKSSGEILSSLKHMTKQNKGCYHEDIDDIIEFLSSNKKGNKLIMDKDFGTRIRESIDVGDPVVISMNWTLCFGRPKVDGDCEHHAVAVEGYNKKGARIIDSHQEYYKYKLKEFKSGKYTLSWENLMTVMGQGDIVVPSKYNIARYKEILETYGLV